MSGLLSGLQLGLAYDLPAWLAAIYGLTFGLAVGLAGASSAWTRYYISVGINAARRRGPLRFGEFLHWAQQAGLLRVSGIAYQFRHRQLQDWLTTLDDHGS